MGTAVAVVLALGSIACAIWFGIRYERSRINTETTREIAKLKSTVRQVRDTVAGMDEDELDRFLYGPADRLPAGDDREQRG